MVEKAITWHLDSHEDERGKLVVVEANRGVPFPIRRVFWIYDIPSTVTKRAGHAHQYCEQLLVCVFGACRVRANGDEFMLTNPNKALYVPPGVHIDLDLWEYDTVLLVLCSHHYDEEDYEVSGIDDFAAVTV